MKRPSFQFYPADWRKDAELQSCSIAARGLWVEMLCIMHESSLYGHLAINGKPMTAAQLARLVGESEKTIKALLEELEGAGVFSTSCEGCIFSRRMVKDEEVRNIKAEAGKGGKEFGVLGAEHGKKGGRPKKDRGDIKTPHITPHQEEIKTPEEPPPSSSSSSSSSNNKKDLSSGDADDHEQPDDKQPKPKADRIPYDEIFDLYNEIVAGPFNRPAVKIRNDSRKRAIKKIWNLGTQTKTLPWWEDLFVRATHNQRWMNGGPGKDGTFWEGANFDFLLREDNFVKIVE